MTKLYFNLEGRWQIPGQQDPQAERVDVPNPPAELAAWLNDRNASPNTKATRADPIELDVAPCNTAGEEPAIGNPNRCSKCKAILSATIAGADASAISRDLDAIADWMIEAPTWALDRLSEICRDRAAEFANAAGRAN